jgi:hypothetical protein
MGTRRTFLVGTLAVTLGVGGVMTDLSAKRRKRRRHKRRQRGATLDDVLAVLSPLAERMLYGVRDEGTPLATLEERLAAGKEIEALCGTQSKLAVRALQRHGLAARLVGALREPYGPDNSHVMLEVRAGGAWHCYDIMSNTQAVGADGRSLSVVDWCAAREQHWRRIATDANWPRTDAEIADIYRRVMGTPWLSDYRGRGVFHDPARAAAIVAARPWLHPVSEQEWLALLA